MNMEKICKSILKSIVVRPDGQIDEEKSIKSMMTTFEDYKITKKPPQRDPDAPKRSKTAYINFFVDIRKDKDLLRDVNEAMGTNVSKESLNAKSISEMWSFLKGVQGFTDEFYNKADEDKVRYKEELDKYTPKEGFTRTGAKSKKKITRETTAPTPPKSSYSQFIHDLYTEESKKKYKGSYMTYKRETTKIWNEHKKNRDSVYVKYEKESIVRQARYQELLLSYVPSEGFTKTGLRVREKKPVPVMTPTPAPLTTVGSLSSVSDIVSNSMESILPGSSGESLKARTSSSRVSTPKPKRYSEKTAKKNFYKYVINYLVYDREGSEITEEDACVILDEIWIKVKPDCKALWMEDKYEMPALRNFDIYCNIKEAIKICNSVQK